MPKRAFFLVGLLVLLALACVSSGPRQTEEGQRIGHWVVSQWLQPRPDRPVSLVVREKNGQRRVLLRDGDRPERFLGTMTRGLGADIPLETFFVQVQETRFIVFYVPAEIADRARAVQVYALDPLYSDPAQSTVLKSVVFDKNGLGVMPIFPKEFDNWSHLTSVLIYTHDIDAAPLVEAVFDPPLPIAARFQPVTLP